MIMKKLNLKKISYDIITSSKNVTKITSQKFSVLGPPRSKFLAALVREGKVDLG